MPTQRKKTKELAAIPTIGRGTQREIAQHITMTLVHLMHEHRIDEVVCTYIAAAGFKPTCAVNWVSEGPTQAFPAITGLDPSVTRQMPSRCTIERVMEVLLELATGVHRLDRLGTAGLGYSGHMIIRAQPTPQGTHLHIEHEAREISHTTHLLAL